MTNSTAPSTCTGVSRRNFLKTSTATAVGTAIATSLAAPAVHAAGSDLLRVGLIGCGRRGEGGGRGRGAAENCVHAGPNVQLYAMADLFPDHLEYSRKFLKDRLGDKVNVSDDRCFSGFNAYKDLIALKDIDIVILTSPPGFRPLHLQAAVEAGKHIFCEKPVAVDGPGVRSVLKTIEEARRKNVSLVSGLCWRYDFGMQETFKRIHDGLVGDIVALQCTYNTGPLWVAPRQSGWSDMEWQCRNWLYFAWLSGDFNVEQHIHSLDKMAWAMKDEYPVKAVGLGGRQQRTGPEYGHIFDHHSVVYEYANGVKVFSNCRQQKNCANDVTDHVFGTKATVDVMKYALKSHHGKPIWKYRPADNVKDDGMYQNEHNELIASIRSGKPINNGDYMTKSSLMAIMGRMATYTGKVITWDMALNSKEDLSPPKYDWISLATPAVAKPGVTRFV